SQGTFRKTLGRGGRVLRDRRSMELTWSLTNSARTRRGVGRDRAGRAPEIRLPPVHSTRRSPVAPSRSRSELPAAASTSARAFRRIRLEYAPAADLTASDPVLGGERDRYLSQRSWRSSFFLLGHRAMNLGEEIFDGDAVNDAGFADRLEGRDVTANTVHVVTDEDARGGGIRRQDLGDSGVGRQLHVGHVLPSTIPDDPLATASLSGRVRSLRRRKERVERISETAGLPRSRRARAA